MRARAAAGFPPPSAKATARRRSAPCACCRAMSADADSRAARSCRWRRSPPTLGWCEVPDDRNYNRPVRMPYAASHERMLRADNLYDACIVLDWNIRPRRRGRGSAIFFHLARPGFTPTQGCVAVTPRGDGAAVAAPVTADGAGRQALELPAPSRLARPSRVQQGIARDLPPHRLRRSADDGCRYRADSGPTGR